jgi:hypothetical protein
VNYFLVEQQLKAEGFPYSHVSVPSLSNVYLGFSGTMPALCIEAPIILAGAEGVDAVERNIRILPVSWWISGKAEVGIGLNQKLYSVDNFKQKVLTLVKLKGIHSTLSKESPSVSVIRISPSVIYDPREGLIVVMSTKIDGCILHFLTEWSKLSKTIVIAQQSNVIHSTLSYHRSLISL